MTSSRFKKIKSANPSLSDIVENALNEIYVFDAETLCFELVNERARRNLGYNMNELRSMTPLQLNPEYTEQSFSDLLAPLRAGKRNLILFETIHKRKCGSTYPVEVHLQLIETSAKPVFVSLILDLTHRRQVDNHLGDARWRLEHILDASPSIIYTCSPHGNLPFTFVSENISTILGYQPDEFISNPEVWLSNIHPDDAPGILANLPKAGKQRNYQQEYRFRLKNGDYRWLHDALRLVGDDDAKPLHIVGSLTDITDRKHAEHRLHEERGLLRSLVDSIPDLIFCKNAEHVYLRCNTAFENYFGAKENAIVGRTDFDFVDDELAKFFREQDTIMMETGYSRTNEEWVTYPDGKEVLLETLKTPYFGPNGEVLGLIGISRDITERRADEERLKLFAQVFEQCGDGIMITDAQNIIISVNRAFTAITGYSADEVVGKSPGILSSGRHDSLFYSQMWEQINREEHWQGEIWNRRKNGDIYPQQLSISKVKDKKGQASHYIGIHTDITQRKDAEAHIEYLAHYDGLTGLPNRAVLEDRVSHSIAVASRHHKSLALLFIDLDHFKNINDSLGHSVGDQLLIEISQRLKKSVREEDTVSRLGGDEFNVLLIDSDEDGAALVARKIISEVSCPICLEPHRLYITPSIGISLYPANGLDYETLSSNADTALYQAKRNGRNQYQFFTPQMQVKALRRIELENHLRRALERDELHLVFQPQMDIYSGDIVGAEVLLRWNHPEWGAVPPAEFIPVTEDTGMILSIGDWVMESVIAQSKRWQESGLPPITLAVNLSLAQFREKTLLEKAKSLLEKYGLDASYLELELTESVAMQNAEAAIDITRQLRKLGVRLSIDDFGTGYSSLSYLKKFAIHKIKIDQSFVQDITANSEDAAIVDAIIKMADSLGVETIAEGVETEDQYNSLRQKGCNQLQGYYFSRPLAAKEFSSFVKQHSLHLH